MLRFPPGSGAGNGAKEPVPPHGREPDLLVFDLDPGLPATIVECCRVAEALRPLLESSGLRPLAKTSGGKGLQLYAAIGGRTAEQASDEARAFAQRMEAELPGLAVSRMTKTLREGKVLIDWSQNNGSKTTVAPYSLRARVHPTVSTPVTWDEVTACRHPGDLFFTAPDVITRVAGQGDLFAPLLPLARTGCCHPVPGWQAVQVGRRWTSQTVAAMSSTASASSQPPSIHWNAQNRPAGW
jgi:DNA primase